MFKLHAVQAEEGDCLILEHGTARARRFVLIDGGPAQTYKKHLRGAIARIVGGKLDLAVLSHVDNDHVLGLVDLFVELRSQATNDEEPLVKIAGLWHNAFSATAGTDVEARLTNALAAAPNQAALLAASGRLAAIKEGSVLTGLAIDLRIPINKGFTRKLVSVETEKTVFTSGKLTLSVVGPTRDTLAKLQDKWSKWLDKNAAKLRRGQITPLAMSDVSVENGSSIAILAERSGKTLLLTGDIRGDHLIDGLEAAGKLEGGRLHVDVLKVQHHGSDRNATARFFESITADAYVISANGKHGNPDAATLGWIVAAAKKAGREIALYFTNKPPSVAAFLKEHPPAKSGYKATFLARSAHELTVTLAP